MARRVSRLAAALTAAGIVASGVDAQSTGNITAVYDLLERILPGSSVHFQLALVDSCLGAENGKACFSLSDLGPGTPLSVSGTTASEVAAGIGHYMRDYLNFTLGWPRGGGSLVYTPTTWPSLGSGPTTVTRARIVPFSYIENVCTHSYSLVWYDQSQWEAYIDWMALSGINMALAMTGQEEVAYKVFQSFGLTDEQIRTWFNGPAFLTWSRGQNEYGNDIAGPLPRSWMTAQWSLQRDFILPRMRSLGIIGQLPGFQGNVPWDLSFALHDNNMTQQGDTGWMYSTDPWFATIADKWMATLCADFGCTDHWYQMDGYFDGGTAPWMVQGIDRNTAASAPRHANAAQRNAVAHASANGIASLHDDDRASVLPDCQWSAIQPNTYLAGCDHTNCASYNTVAEAEAACIADFECGGITSRASGAAPWELRAANSPTASPSGEASYYLLNPTDCRPPPPPITPDPIWRERGAAAYAGLNRTDPDAIWSFQGWAIVDWSTWSQGSSFYGFVDAVPQDKFVIIDMSVDGSGEWQKWNYSSFFSAPFIWTTLHDFGGTDGMKGDLDRINQIPFGGMPDVYGVNSSAIGTGFTPEGIDQNPAYYEHMLSMNWRTAPATNITAEMIMRAHRRYNMSVYNADVAAAWTLLVNSTYAQDLSVQDSTGIPHFPGSSSQFNSDRFTPTPRLCLTYQAWGSLITAAESGDLTYTHETFRYDLINLGREMMAQLSTPVSMNYSDAIHAAAGKMDGTLINTTGTLYIDLLGDVDTLLAAEPAFLLGPWLNMARAWGSAALNNGTAPTDCAADALGLATMDCADFYEWNARSQLTTWNPTPPGAAQKPSGPDDYASKHWSGLVRDYYRARAEGILITALSNAASGIALNTTEVASFEASLAYEWQTDYPNGYPVVPVGDALAVTLNMYNKWGKTYYEPYCGSGASL